MRRAIAHIVVLAAALACPPAPRAETGAGVEAQAGGERRPWAEAQVSGTACTATGDFAPYMLASWRHGRIVAPGMQFEASVKHALDTARRLSWGACVDVVACQSADIAYRRYTASEGWSRHAEHQPLAWAQQLYGEAKYRSVFLTVGMKERGSALLNSRLSSGDLVQSGNCRPIPEARTGFIDFQDIPFTNGWVQIQGEISYGKMADNGYIKSHYNYYDYHITLGPLYTYKRCYFRTKPSQRLSVTVGMQVGGFFGGTAQYWSQGKLLRERKFDSSLKSFVKMFLPMGENGEDFYVGQSFGTWDMFARYRLRGGAEVCAYFQWPWEDGSGIAKRNQLDGLWGIEYRASRRGWVTGAVLEYVDFRDQSGPIHYHPDSRPDLDISQSMSGRDNYCNNGYYNSYANYGMAIGTPFMPSPVYNTDGYPAFACNRVNGFHAGVEGCLSRSVGYRALVSHRRGLGTYEVPYYRPRMSTSAMVEADWDASSAGLRGLSVKGQLAIDRGSLTGNNFGLCVTITYTGSIR